MWHDSEILSHADDCITSGCVPRPPFKLQDDCIASGVLDDCIASGALDDCDVRVLDDCDVRGVLDDCVTSRVLDDCVTSRVLDDCIASGVLDDCDVSGILDDCDVSGILDDCDASGILDDCDASEILDDCDVSGSSGSPLKVQDECITSGSPVKLQSICIAGSPFETSELNSNAHFDPFGGCFGHDSEFDFDAITPQTFEAPKDYAVWSPKWTAIDSKEPDALKGPSSTKPRRKRKRLSNAPPTEVLTLKQSSGVNPHMYHPEKATNGLGERNIYICGYCDYQKLSCSEAGDGQVRIRCKCGGVRADGVPRMHATWTKKCTESFITPSFNSSAYAALRCL